MLQRSIVPGVANHNIQPPHQHSPRSVQAPGEPLNTGLPESAFAFFIQLKALLRIIHVPPRYWMITPLGAVDLKEGVGFCLWGSFGNVWRHV